MHKTNSSYVLLDVTPLKPDFIKNRFPTIYETCYEWGIDITRDPIPVVPAAHYMCGGIKVNTWAETSIPRLFALGECACTGVHGANRLASNSLLEALVFATRAAHRIKKITDLNLKKTVAMKGEAQTGSDFKLAVKELMSAYAGVMRSGTELIKAHARINEYRSQFDDGIHLINAESKNLVEIACLIIRCCLLRKESRGLHYMLEYPGKNEKYLKDTVIKKNEGMKF
jgi:L-aspartate oxidase